MSKKRSQLESIYSYKYKHIIAHNIADKNFCLYCGDYAQCLDHQPPVSAVDRISGSHGAFEYALIPSCSECNSLLGDKLTNTVSDRFNLAKRLLIKKYRAMLAATATDRDDWYLTGDLKRQCKAYDAAGKDIRDRVSFAGYGFDIDGANQDVRRFEILINDKIFTDKYKALAYACKLEGIKYETLCKVVRVDDHTIDSAIAKFRQLQWIKKLTAIIKAEYKGRWKKMPSKLIEAEVKKATSLTTEQAMVEKIDSAYEAYLDKMGMGR